MKTANAEQPRDAALSGIRRIPPETSESIEFFAIGPDAKWFPKETKTVWCDCELDGYFFSVEVKSPIGDLTCGEWDQLVYEKVGDDRVKIHIVSREKPNFKPRWRTCSAIDIFWVPGGSMWKMAKRAMRKRERDRRG